MDDRAKNVDERKSESSSEWKIKDVVVPIFCVILGAALPETLDAIKRWLTRPIVANFEYYSEGNEAKLAIVPKPVIFKNTSRNAAKIKWIFPDGSTSDSNTVIRQFSFASSYQVKLLAYSENNEVVDQQIQTCTILADLPGNLTSIHLKRPVETSQMPYLDLSIQIGGARGHLRDAAGFQINEIPMGNQRYRIYGRATRHLSHMNISSCDINSVGTIHIMPGKTYQIGWIDFSNCAMKLEQVD